MGVVVGMLEVVGRVVISRRLLCVAYWSWCLWFDFGDGDGGARCVGRLSRMGGEMVRLNISKTTEVGETKVRLRAVA